MISITDLAKNYISSLHHSAEGMVWLVCIRWDRGDFDNKRSAAGEVIWEHSGPRGWVIVNGFPFEATKVSGQSVAPGIYAEVVTYGQSFPGGAIDLENGRLLLRDNGV